MCVAVAKGKSELKNKRKKQKPATIESIHAPAQMQKASQLGCARRPLHQRRLPSGHSASVPPAPPSMSPGSMHRVRPSEPSPPRPSWPTRPGTLFPALCLHLLQGRLPGQAGPSPVPETPAWKATCLAARSPFLSTHFQPELLLRPGRAQVMGNSRSSVCSWLKSRRSPMPGPAPQGRASRAVPQTLRVPRKVST